MAAYFLKERNENIFGKFMSNWDSNDETAIKSCTADKDILDARQVCDILKIPLVENLSCKEYWNRVFSHYIEGQKTVRHIFSISHAKYSGNYSESRHIMQ